jgi:hypothetical protein
MVGGSDDANAMRLLDGGGEAWDENGPWPETYKCGLRVPSVAKLNAPPVPLFVSVTMSLSVDKALQDKEAQQWLKEDEDTREMREKERAHRQSKREAARAAAGVGILVRVVVVCTGDVRVVVLSRVPHPHRWCLVAARDGAGTCS